MILLIVSVFWLGGLVISSFTVIPILTIFVFGIPTTRKLESVNLLKTDNRIIKTYYISVSILVIIFLFTLWITKVLFPTGFIGLVTGIGWSLLLGLGKIGRNKNNVSDYMQVNERHFKGTVQEVASTIFSL